MSLPSRILPPLRAHGPALLVYILLTIIFLWPVAGSLGHRAAGWEGDNLFYVRQMWWVKHALLDLHISPFFDPDSYYPAGYDIAHGSITPANTVLGLPLTVLFGPVESYNLMVLLSFVLTSLGTYLWVARLTSSRTAGFLAGVIAGFLPYRLAHLPGHMPTMTIQWFPLCLYAFEMFREKPRAGRGVFLGVMAALIALSDWYYGYSAALLLPFYALLRTRPWKEFWRRRAVWLGLLAAAAAALVLIVPFIIPYVRMMAAGGLSRSIVEMESWSMNFYDFFLPNLLHPVWGKALTPVFYEQARMWVEHGVSLGYIAMGLALYGFLRRRRQPAAGAWAALWVVSYLIALGPTLHAFDKQVIFPLPAFAARWAAAFFGLFPPLSSLKELAIAKQGTPVPLPSFFLYLFVPFTKGMRVMARFGLWTGLATAALAGLGLKVLLEKLGRRGLRPILRAGLLAGLTTLVLFESWRTVPVVELRPRKVDIWLSKQPASTVIVELPLGQTFRPFQDYYQTVHERKTVFGPVSDSFYPRERGERADLLADFPSPGSVEALRSFGTTHVLLTPSQIPDWPRMRRLVERSGAFRRERTAGGVWVYALQ